MPGKSDNSQRSGPMSREKDKEEPVAADWREDLLATLDHGRNGNFEIAWFIDRHEQSNQSGKTK